MNGRALAAPHPPDEAPTPAALGLHASAAAPEDQHLLAAAPAPSAAPPPAAPSDAAPAPHSPTNGNGPIPTRASHPPTNGHGPVPTPARVAGRARRSPMATPAEQAAADLALLRTFGVRPTVDEPEIALEGCAPDDEPVAGTAQPVAFHVLARDGSGIPGAKATLLDDHGQETANTRTTRNGHGVLTARHPGGYMLVIAADGYQPGAITIAVTDGPVDAEIPLTRSASLAGTVGGEDGPVVGAQLALVQHGELVDTAKSGPDGAYRFRDLSSGEYGLSVSAHECEPAALVVEIAERGQPAPGRRVGACRPPVRRRNDRAAVIQLREAVRRGHRGGILTTSIPASARTASNEAVNCPARSRARNRNRAARSPRSITSLRACCVVHGPSGCPVTPSTCR